MHKMFGAWGRNFKHDTSKDSGRRFENDIVYHLRRLVASEQKFRKLKMALNLVR